MAVAKNRIWELDALRGLFILCVVLVHTIFDLQLFGFVGEDTPVLFNIIRDYGGILFVLISGICVTLGSHSFRRGAIVFLCGMVITGVTYALYYIDPANESLLIHFGVLHLLGLCMILYPLYKRLPAPQFRLLYDRQRARPHGLSVQAVAAAAISLYCGASSVFQLLRETFPLDLHAAPARYLRNRFTDLHDRE